MNLKEPFVITISREIGSGGRTIGRILSQKLHTLYFDKDLIHSLEERFNLTASGIEKLKAQKKNWLSEFIQFVTPMPSAKTLGVDSSFTHEFRIDVTPDDIYKAETEILKELAREGSCIIAGRSGFHVLKDHPNHLRVFITASLENRITRVMNKQCLNREQAVKLIEGIDKARENYIQRYTGTSRYDARNYDLGLKADGPSEEELASLILAYIG
jgi:cytidylate kinase